MNLFNINSSEIEEKYADLAHQSEPAPLLAIVYAALAVIAFIGNISLLVYIIVHKLYHNFISSHFIAHLCCTNLVALILLLPIFIYTVWTGQNLFEHSHVLCRVQVRLFQQNECKYNVMYYISFPGAANMHSLDSDYSHGFMHRRCSPTYICAHSL